MCGRYLRRGCAVVCVAAATCAVAVVRGVALAWVVATVICAVVVCGDLSMARGRRTCVGGWLCSIELVDSSMSTTYMVGVRPELDIHVHRYAGIYIHI